MVKCILTERSTRLVFICFGQKYCIFNAGQMFGRLDGFLRVDKRVLKREEKSTNICIWGFNRDIVECKERVTGQKTEVGILF